ncbi:aminoglycoside phosphotransferase family protein [Oceanobacter mangrovi]|uniref:aminoglycoside phosphotransferase family protein n=1 Tax=Oceanobacter mangrovi TaxID=2862510 RepID=UPI001C8EEBE8|nr:phosphotransferase [Oceanobacter mangrovi]
MDQRLNGLVEWASDQIRQLADIDLQGQVEAVSGDASFRRYFRLRGLGSSWILVDAPADKEDNPRFIAIARRWRQSGVAVPAVLAADVERGYMLLEDFGDTLLWQAAHQDDATEKSILALYRQAIDQLIHLQSVPKNDIPPYDAELLDREMELFRDWLCQQQLGMTLSADEHQLLDQTFACLKQQALAQPVVTVHRDYHSRNLMLKPDHSLGVIDFQDAVAGPACYDLVSLLRDCYVRWPQPMIDELMAYYWENARPAGHYLADWPQFVKDFDWMGMQRHLKAAGIFARLNLRDGKPSYLADIPNTCQYLLEVSARYAELADFHQWLVSTFQPALLNLSLRD